MKHGDHTIVGQLERCAKQLETANELAAVDIALRLAESPHVDPAFIAVGTPLNTRASYIVAKVLGLDDGPDGFGPVDPDWDKDKAQSAMAEDGNCLDPRLDEEES